MPRHDDAGARWRCRYKHLRWMEVVMSGTLGAAAEWKEDREKLMKAMKRAIGMAGRIPYLCADQLGELMGIIMEKSDNFD